MLSEVVVNEAVTTSDDHQQMQRVFAALANTTRLRILETLSQGEKSVNALCAETGAQQSQVSHQLNQLKGARLVRWERRGNQVIYSLHSASVAEMLALAQGLTN